MTRKRLPPKTRLDEACLAERLLVAQRISTGADGSLNHEWLALHIWLAYCDLIRSGIMAANRLGEEKFVRAISRHLSACHNLFCRVLRTTLPLMTEFADPTKIQAWRDAGGGLDAAHDPHFYDCAWEAGIPVCAEDADYALGAGASRGKEACFIAEEYLPRARLH